jgi:hypothetical protein
MRSHGVPDYPDPKVNGNSVSFGVHAGGAGSDLNPNAPAFKAASQACRSLQPGGSQGPVSAPDLATEVKFAVCMRSHGFPGFPDPDGGGVFNLPSAINPNSTRFGSASTACRSQTNVHHLNMRVTGGGS